jgi:hypothetical protein
MNATIIPCSHHPEDTFGIPHIGLSAVARTSSPLFPAIG